jgi:hypothetical protein
MNKTKFIHSTKHHMTGKVMHQVNRDWTENTGDKDKRKCDISQNAIYVEILSTALRIKPIGAHKHLINTANEKEAEHKSTYTE